MGRMHGRVSRLERGRRAAGAAIRGQNRFLMATLGQAMLDAQPGLALVEPGDTDPATYRDIQITLAQARGDHATAERLLADAPRRPRPRLTGDCGRDYSSCVEWLNRVLIPSVRDQGEREDRAVVKARKRVEMAAKNRDGECAPPKAGKPAKKLPRRARRGRK